MSEIAASRLTPDQSTARMEMREAWKYWDFRFVPNYVKLSLKLGLCAVFLGLTVVLPVTLTAYQRVNYNEYGVVKYLNGSIGTKVLDPGMNMVGHGATVIGFSRFDLDFDFGFESSPIEVRVQDGQIVEMDISFQIELERNRLPDIYRSYRNNYHTTFKNIARSTLRDVASKYQSDFFFTNRTQIANEMRSLIAQEAVDRQARLTGFQVRKIALPAALDNRIIEIQLRSQEARRGVKQLELDQFTTNTDRIILELKTNRTQRNEKVNQQTNVTVLEITKQKEEIEKQMDQIVAKIQEDGKKNRTLYEKQTELILETIELEITQVEEATRRLTDSIEVGLATNISIYNQESENMELNYDKEVTLIKEGTKQNVTRIVTETEEHITRVRNYLSDLLSQAQLSAQLGLIQADLEAAKLEAQAFVTAHQGVPAGAFVALHQARAQLPTVKLSDVKTPLFQES